MKFKRGISLILAGVCALSVWMTGCGKKDDSNYNVLEYVTLGQYKGIEYTPTSAELTEEEIDEQLQLFLEENATVQEETTGRAAKEGDILLIDYVGKIDDVAFDNGSAQDQELELGSHTYMDGFEDQLIGAKVGETVEVKVTFADPYPRNPDLAGKPAVFTVSVKKLSEKIIPELTDDFIKEKTSSDTVEEYREKLAKTLQEQKEQNAKTADQEKIFAQIVENASVSNYSQTELDEQAEQYMSYYTQLAESIGVSLEDLVKSYMQTTVKDLKAQLAEESKTVLKERMVLRAIAETENLTISDEEYQQGLKKYAASAGIASTAAFEQSYGKNKIMMQLQIDKALDFVTENAVAK